MTIRIKICCISSIAEAQLAVAHGASALGLVGAMPSGPGPISDDDIAKIAAAIPPPIATFLLTSRTDPQDIIEHVKFCRVNTVQLVDAIKIDDYAKLRQGLPGIKLVQVLHVCGENTLDEAKEIAPLVDALLLDSGNPNLAVKELGGTGRVHDWSISKRIVASVAKSVFLAGGLSAENIAQAIKIVRPFGVDLCSSVRSHGTLDPIKLKKFFRAFHCGTGEDNDED